MNNTTEIVRHCAGIDNNKIAISIAEYSHEKYVTLYIDIDTSDVSSMHMINLSKNEIRQLGEALIKAANSDNK